MLKIIRDNEEETWNKIVKSFANSDIYYLLSYVKAFKIHGDGDPLLFYFEHGDNKAINVVMKRDISNCVFFNNKLENNSVFDITTPYGYGGFLLNEKFTNESFSLLKIEYTEYCKNNRIVSEFVRFSPVLKNADILKDFYSTKKLGNTITMELLSQKQIWDNLASKCRNMIRKSIKNNIEIYWGRSQYLINKFKPMYESTMKKDNALDYYYFKDDFYKSILSDLKYNSLIFYAQQNNEIIAMSIIMFNNENMHYHLSAIDKKYQHLAPTNLLLYEAACWGCENGYKAFHLGGGLGSNEDSLYSFKKSFSKFSDTSFTIGNKIFNQEKYDELVDIRSKNGDFNKDSKFFPIYRV